jgi:hypothetical protein
MNQKETFLLLLIATIFWRGSRARALSDGVSFDATDLGSRDRQTVLARIAGDFCHRSPTVFQRLENHLQLALPGD